MLAHAESAEKVYEVEVPSVESTPKTTPHKTTPTHQNTETGKKAEGSVAHTETGESNGGGTGAEPEAEEKGGSKEGSSKEGGGNPPTTGGGGGNKPNGGGNGGGQPEGNVSEGRAVPEGTTESSGGSSSPVVPILIAVAVLAAISIGVVLYRQRKSGQDPDDGRADDRVSSPNAS